MWPGLIHSCPIPRSALHSSLFQPWVYSPEEINLFFFFPCSKGKFCSLYKNLGRSFFSIFQYLCLRWSYRQTNECFLFWINLLCPFYYLRCVWLHSVTTLLLLLFKPRTKPHIRLTLINAVLFLLQGFLFLFKFFFHFSASWMFRWDLVFLPAFLCCICILITLQVNFFQILQVNKLCMFHIKILIEKILDSLAQE